MYKLLILVLARSTVTSVQLALSKYISVTLNFTSNSAKAVVQ